MKMSKTSLLQPSRKLCPVICRDDDPWDAAGGPGREAPSPPGPDDTEEPSASTRHLRSARGNGLDLRPATAAAVSGSQSLSSTSQDANSTRQTDLGSLSAQLFAPRPQVHDGNLSCHSSLKHTSCQHCCMHLSAMCHIPCESLIVEMTLISVLSEVAQSGIHLYSVNAFSLQTCAVKGIHDTQTKQEPMLHPIFILFRHIDDSPIRK